MVAFLRYEAGGVAEVNQKELISMVALHNHVLKFNVPMSEVDVVEGLDTLNQLKNALMRKLRFL